MNTNKILKTGLIAMFALIFSVSCEDDSLPGVGDIVDANPPEADFFVTEGPTAFIKNLTNSTRRGFSEIMWTLPEGAEFTFNDQGVLTTSTDNDITVIFPELIEDPDNPDLGYLVGIEAIDANGVSSGLEFINVLVQSDPSRDLATASATFVEGVSNFERIFTNTSVNAPGGVIWSVFENGVELDIDQVLMTSNFNFLNQTRTSEEVSLVFPGSGTYEVFVTAINFNGIEALSDPQTVIVENLSIPEPSFTYSSSDDYTIQTFVNTTPDTATQFWTLPAGATFVNGSVATDQTIDVSFANSGTFPITLEITSNSFDDDGNPIVLESLAENETQDVAIVNSLSAIPVPSIIAGGFEPDPDNLTEEGLERFLGTDDRSGNADASKEYWIADGVTSRAFIPGTTELYPAFPGATNDDVDWFETGDFNRVRVSNTGRNGVSASWNPGDERVAVQYIEVLPGVDYKVSFFYFNDSGSNEIGLLGLILDPNVVTESQLSIEGNVLASVLAIDQTTIFEEATLSFTNTSSERTAIKLYFRTSDNAGDYRLDDVSIAID